MLRNSNFIDFIVFIGFIDRYRNKVPLCPPRDAAGRFDSFANRLCVEELFRTLKPREFNLRISKWTFILFCLCLQDFNN